MAIFQIYDPQKKIDMKKFIFCLLALMTSSSLLLQSQSTGQAPGFRVIAFFTGKNDAAHISFVHEANRWFPKMAKQFNFDYDSTTNWAELNADVLDHYQV